MRTFEYQNYYKLFCNKNENNEQLREYLRHFTDSRFIKVSILYDQEQKGTKTKTLVHTETPYELFIQADNSRQHQM